MHCHLYIEPSLHSLVNLNRMDHLARDQDGHRISRIVTPKPGTDMAKVGSVRSQKTTFNNYVDWMRSLTRLRAIARLGLSPRARRLVPVARSYATNPKPPVAGQPLSDSHPHLVKAGHLTPGITADEYEERRRKLMEGLEPGAVVVVMGGTVRLVSQRE